MNPNGDSWEAELSTIRLHYGAGCVRRLGEIAAGLARHRVLIVTDPGLRRAGHVETALDSLAGAGLETEVFDQIEPDPTTHHVDSGVAFARRGEMPELIVALGGGSAMDCAKGINFVVTNGGTMEEYWGFGKAERPLLPSIAVPTTAGTGSDAQSYALISRAADGRKMACGDRKARFRAVLLDPELATTAPREVVATAGIDAISHAVEAYVTRTRNPVSSMLAAAAWKLLNGALESGLGGGGVEVYGRLLIGAHLAGAAIETSMLGAAHAAANPLTARHRILHGEAVGLMLPWVVRANRPVAASLYGELAGGGEALVARIEELRRLAGLPERLSERGVGRADLPELARRATDEWTGRYNPRSMEEADFLRLYEQAL